MARANPDSEGIILFLGMQCVDRGHGSRHVDPSSLIPGDELLGILSSRSNLSSLSPLFCPS